MRPVILISSVRERLEPALYLNCRKKTLARQNPSPRPNPSENSIPALVSRFQKKNKNMQQGGGSETEVTWEDQQNINKFGRLNNRFHELKDEIKTAKETNDNLEDASNELILSDEDVVRFQIGEVFTHVPREEVENRLKKMKEETTKSLEKLEEEKDSILAQMAELKKILYGKFKDSINLEED